MEAIRVGVWPGRNRSSVWTLKFIIFVVQDTYLFRNIVVLNLSFLYFLSYLRFLFLSLIYKVGRIGRLLHITIVSCFLFFFFD